MGEEPIDLYGDLCVTPDADARAIKEAYFALVRRFPPETHPEDFQRIRRAFEVLRDPQQRAAYDEARARPAAPVDVEADALWDAARLAAEVGDVDGELRSLRRLVELRPALLRAREVLAERLLRHELPREAEPLLRELVAAAPADPRLLLLWSRALRELGREEEALAAVRRAADCGPEEPAFHVAIADALAALGLRDEARERLDRAERLEGSPRPIPPFVRRRAGYLLDEGKVDQALEEMERAMEAWSDAPAAARRDAVAFLAGFAAVLISRRRWKASNRVLARARAVAPDASPGPMPSEVSLRGKELPAEVWDWLRAQRGDAQWFSWFRPAPRVRWFLAVVGLALPIWWVLSLAFSFKRAYEPDGWAWVAVAFALPFAFLLASLDRAVRRDLFGDGVIVHALHLIEVKLDWIRVTPLLSIEGSYLRQDPRSPGRLEAVFTRVAGHERRIQFPSRVDAEAVGGAILRQRQRALDLLAEGALFHEPKWDLLRPELLARGGLARRIGILRPGLVGAAVVVALALGAALGGAASVVATENAEAEAIAMARRTGTVAAWQRYVVAWPAGAHAAEAKEQIALLQAAARQALVRRGAVSALLQSFDTWSVAGRGIPVAMEIEVQRPADLEPGVLSPVCIDSPAGVAPEGARLVERLDSVVYWATDGASFVKVDAVGSGARGAPLRLRLVFVAGGDELTPRARSPRRALALDAVWTLEARAAGGAAFELLGTGRVAGPERLEIPAADWEGDAAVASERVCRAQIAALRPAVALAAAGALGLRGAP